MREIKFRAWIESDRQMYDVLQLQQPFPDEGFYRVFINKARTPDAPMNYRITGGNTLMQFTGLKDKNGKDIYEGDLVIIDLGTTKSEPVEMKWHIGGFKYATMFEMGHTCEVTGNIYENPLPPS